MTKNNDDMVKVELNFLSVKITYSYLKNGEGFSHICWNGEYWLSSHAVAAIQPNGFNPFSDEEKVLKLLHLGKLYNHEGYNSYRHGVVSICQEVWDKHGIPVLVY